MSLVALLRAETSAQPSPPSSISPLAKDGTTGQRCVVCDSTHRVATSYGAARICHGCRSFFRRAVVESTQLRCASGSGNCEVAGVARHHCRACRFQQCIRAGMDGAKTKWRLNRRADQQPSARLPKIRDTISAQSSSLAERLCAVEHALDSAPNKKTSKELADQFAITAIDIDADFNCRYIASSADIAQHYHLAFILLTEWAGSIDEFRDLKPDDQVLLFRRNFGGFCWLHFVWRSVRLHQERLGVPLGNGAYLPHSEEKQSKMDPKQLVDNVGVRLMQMSVDEEEYCLLKAMALFQHCNELTAEGQQATADFIGRLSTALAAHVDKKFPMASQEQRSRRYSKLIVLLSTLQQIGHLETDLVRHLCAATAL